MSLCHLGHGNRLVCGCAHIIGHTEENDDNVTGGFRAGPKGI